jgi:hypothetical protein
MTGLGSIFRILGAASALAVSLTLALASASHGRALSDAEKTSLSTTVSDFNGAIKSANIDRISQTVPPRIFDLLAKKANIDAAVIRETMTRMLKSTMEEAPFEDFSMDVEHAAFKETPNGDPYALIPTKVSLNVEGQRFKVSTHTLALLDGETWYLVRVSEDQQVMLLREAYPNFVAEKFPESTTETLN